MNATKYCLLTGASGGIGSAIAHALAAQGYTLMLHGRNKEKLLALQKSLPNNAYILLGDLSKAEDRAEVLTQAFNIGPIDLLVNNAGIANFSPLSMADEQTITQLININLTSTMLFTKAYIAQLTSNNSHPRATIINVGSAFGYIGHPGFSAYCASKFGLRGFTESLARELSDTNIRVAFFAPRATQTALNSSEVDALNSALGNAVDKPQVVAKAFIAFLNSKQQRAVVGWPEKLFARLNGVVPELVDKAMASKLPKIKEFFTNKDKSSLQKNPKISAISAIKIEEVHHEKI